MNIIRNTGMRTNWELVCLLLSTLTVYAASYVITPLLPIYFVESTANGGLAWSRADAFSIFGTFLALIYISPFIGGLLGDFVLGKLQTALLGYTLFGCGLITLNMYTDQTVVGIALLALALGIGFVKVNLAAALGRLPQEARQKAYEYFYVTTCLGFVGGGLLSNPIFSAFQMTGIVTVAFSCMGLSICFFFGFFGKEIFRSPQTQPQNKQSSSLYPATVQWTVCLFHSSPARRTILHMLQPACHWNAGLPSHVRQPRSWKLDNAHALVWSHRVADDDAGLSMASEGMEPCTFHFASNRAFEILNRMCDHCCLFCRHQYLCCARLFHNGPLRHPCVTVCASCLLYRRLSRSSSSVFSGNFTNVSSVPHRFNGPCLCLHWPWRKARWDTRLVRRYHRLFSTVLDMLSHRHLVWHPSVHMVEEDGYASKLE